MSNKSGVAEQIISLPKGGGALKGLGEEFQPDLHTGTGNISVPIAITPGRNGFQPRLTLGYSTGGGNGPFGLGWSLGLPNVSRKTSKGIPRYQDTDTFILSGAEDLVPVREETDAGIARRIYRPRTEGLFARIAYVTGGGCDHWEVTARDGLKSIYGGTPASRVYDRNPDRPGCIFQWLLAETRDPFGNRIVYTYKPEDQADLERRRYEEGHNYNQVYLFQNRIRRLLPGERFPGGVSVLH
jgi:Salmonella virulence plasmid 65kDa B protein.